MVFKVPAERFLVDKVGNVKYIGVAASDATESEPRWKISRLVFDGGETSIEFADGEENYTKIWDDRETYFSPITPTQEPYDKFQLVDSVGSTLTFQNGAMTVAIAEGSVSVTGLRNSITAKRMTVTDVPQIITSTERNGVSIRVLGSETVYFGDGGLTTANGYPKFQFEEIAIDAKETIDISVICESGKTCEIAILELD